MIRMKLLNFAGSFLNHKRSTLVVTLALAAIVCAVAAKAYDSKKPASVSPRENSLAEPSPHLAPTRVSLQSGDIDENIPVELVMLQPYGFEPAVIHRQPGQFLLVVDNHSSVVAGVGLSISNSSLQRLTETTMQLQRSNWDSVLNLSVGTYTLAADNNPKWTCSIVISE